MSAFGFDSVIFSSASTESIIHRFLALMHERWPEMLMDVDGMDAWKVKEQIKFGDKCLDGLGDLPHSIIYFYRSIDMKNHFDLDGWFIDSMNEGPFSLHFRQRRDIIFRLGEVMEVITGEDSVGSVDPYPALLCSPLLLEVTLVSPSDPDLDVFSKQILNLLLLAIGIVVRPGIQTSA